MAIPHAQPGEVVALRADDVEATASQTTTVAKTDEFQLIRLVVHAGKEIPSHRAPGALIVQCLSGKIAFTALGATHELAAGDLLHLPPREPHSVKGIEDGALLLTIVNSAAASAADDEVAEASDESFPASDAPSWTGVTRP